MERQRYRDLVAWQKAMGVVSDVYELTRQWPREELFGLTSQLRRAIVSVPANIAEGQGRTGVNEFLHHLSIAQGSVCETETLLHIARRLSYVEQSALDPLLDQTEEVARLIGGLIRSLRASKQA